ncbi:MULTISPECIES: hypothetical protein [Stenotrophomonas]|uniref:hypothetical protein n=1 Tax=Stenotrophomonas TaxID=40323 RepID=UPI0018D38082|nr:MULTISPECIES: hypothetical protein [Stenotrophomonas]MBH1738089.1 hypothetical protein [Stenotrophomonas maltophilia]WNB80301.1 hypothetical protein Q9R16_00420 [Stenotrophomonas sp. 9]
MNTASRPWPIWLRALQVLGAVWTLPNTLIGLMGGLAGMLGGATLRWSRGDCALVFDRWPWGPGGAITLGNVILHTGHDLGISCRTYAHQAGWGVEPLIRLDDHERAHVYQYMVLGPLYLPVYLLCGGVSARNPFERAADHFARFGHGWWP